MTLRTLLCTLVLAMLSLLNACSSPRVTMEVASQPNVNPDSSGRPSPLIVKMYEMRSDMAFRQGEFQLLFMEPMKVLGSDLVAMDELTFVPGEARTVEYVPMPETRYVGVLAGFRQMERARWRTVVPVNPEKSNKIRLELNDASLIVIDPGKDWSSEESVRNYQERLGNGEEKKDPEPAASAPSGEEGNAPPDSTPAASAPGSVLPRSKQVTDK